MAFTCQYPSSKFSVEENTQLQVSPWEGRILKHLSNVSDFQKTGCRTNFFLICLGALMETSCLESHENKRELGGYCCSRGPAVDRNSCSLVASPLWEEEKRRVECVFDVLRGLPHFCLTWLRLETEPSTLWKLWGPWKSKLAGLGQFQRTCSTAKTNSRENKRKLAHSSNWEFSINPKKMFE